MLIRVINVREIYDKCLNLARHKFAKPILGFVSFIESSFFPIPPDVMIVPMVLAKKEDYLKIFLIAIIFSVLGGVRILSGQHFLGIFDDNN